MKIKFNKPTDLGHGWPALPRFSPWFPVVAAALIGSCAGAVPEPTAAQVAAVAQAYPGATEASLRGGRRLFIDRCSSCHALPSPADRPASAWPAEVAAMAKLAHLTGEEQQAIEAYLVSVAPPAPSQ